MYNKKDNLFHLLLRLMFNGCNIHRKTTNQLSEERRVRDNKILTSFSWNPRPKMVAVHEEKSKYWREQINSKIVIQICRNDFHPESIPKVSWESPLYIGRATPAASHTPNNMHIQRYPRPLKECPPPEGNGFDLSFSSYLSGINLSPTYYFLNLWLNIHISVLATRSLCPRADVSSKAWCRERHVEFRSKNARRDFRSKNEERQRTNKLCIIECDFWDNYKRRQVTQRKNTTTLSDSISNVSDGV